MNGKSGEPVDITTVRSGATRRSAGCVLAVVTLLGAVSSCGLGDEPEAGFGSAQRAAQAFSVEDLPEVEPWNPLDGACRVLLVGDSLVEAALREQSEAFSFMGCDSIVDGLAARSMSTGWQCLGRGGTSMEIVLRADPEPGNPTCRPSGIELLEIWSDFTPAASVTVIALGTNDAGMFTESTWIQRWKRIVELTSGPLLFVTVGAKPADRWVDKASRYNDALRRWCPQEPRCHLAEWDSTDPAKDPTSYTDHVHLTRSAGEMRSVFIAVAARRIAIPAPDGPSRWKAPVVELPPGPTSTTGPAATTETSSSQTGVTSTSSSTLPSSSDSSLPLATPPASSPTPSSEVSTSTIAGP